MIGTFLWMLFYWCSLSVAFAVGRAVRIAPAPDVDAPLRAAVRSSRAMYCLTCEALFELVRCAPSACGDGLHRCVASCPACGAEGFVPLEAWIGSARVGA